MPEVRISAPSVFVCKYVLPRGLPKFYLVDVDNTDVRLSVSLPGATFAVTYCVVWVCHFPGNNMIVAPH